jgi:hypothetical protein
MSNQTVERMAGPAHRLPIRALLEGQPSLTFAFGMNPLSTLWRRAKERKLGIALFLVTWLSLSLAFGISMWFFVYRLATRMTMETWATYAGGLQARVWFQEGHHRLLELSPSEKVEFTGKTNGPFEVWTWTHYTNNPWLTVQTADQEFVDAFNRRMKQLWESRRRKAEQDE